MNGSTRGAPPVCGLLLSPADVRGENGGVLGGCGMENAAVGVDQDDASSTGSNINAEKFFAHARWKLYFPFGVP